jgi:putative flavoprotein involved in K+ transport
MREPEKIQTVIIGAGQSGLSVGYHLMRRGLPFMILEANERVGDTWRKRWDSLRLFTPAMYDSLVGMPFPAPARSFPTKEAMADYLELDARHFELPVRTGVRVTRVSRHAGAFLVETDHGSILAEQVVVAMANYQTRRLPSFAGDLDESIAQIHSTDYRNPSQFGDGGVLVVGAGNSGAEIAHDVIDGGAARSRLSVRTPPQIVRRATLGIPAQLLGMAIRKMPQNWVDPFTIWQRKVAIPDLADRGLPRPAHGVRTAFVTTGTTPILDVGIVAAVKSGRVEVVAAVESFDGADVVLADGSKIRPDVVIAATGFRAGLDRLVEGLDVLGPRGLPTKTDGEPALPGLWFVGFTPTLGGQLREGSIAARKVAEALAAELQRRMQPVGRVDDEPDGASSPDLA